MGDGAGLFAGPATRSSGAETRWVNEHGYAAATLWCWTRGAESGRPYKPPVPIR